MRIVDIDSDNTDSELPINNNILKKTKVKKRLGRPPIVPKLTDPEIHI
jgi:hypothetical protein